MTKWSRLEHGGLFFARFRASLGS